MNPVDYTQLPLRDIHLPAAIGWWPPAPGWWALMACALIAAAVALWRYRSRFRERAALIALRGVQASLDRGDSVTACVQRISTVLRRFAMSVGAGMPVAGLTGDAWLRYLDSRWENDDFAGGAGRLIVYGPYAPPDRIDREDVRALNALCIAWVTAQRGRR